MRGEDGKSGNLFSYVDLEDRVPKGHPLRIIRGIVNDVLENNQEGRVHWATVPARGLCLEKVIYPNLGCQAGTAGESVFPVKGQVPNGSGARYEAN